MRSAAGAFDRGDYRLGTQSAAKAAAIVMGLHGTLKEDLAPELCARLKELYTFVAWRLGVAGAKLSANHAREAERVFTPIAEAFIQAGSETSGEAKLSAVG
jgi:flagellin-specific chaperone FliS